VNRRTFIARAVPAALTVATVASVVPSPAPASAESASPFRVDPVCLNNGQCRCRDCRAGRGDWVLHAAGMVALERLSTALRRLIDDHDEDCTCGICLDAHSLRAAIRYSISALHATLITPGGAWDTFERDMDAADVPDLSHSPEEGVVIALLSALDSLLDLTFGHCPDWECDACIDADNAVRPIRNMIDSLQCAVHSTPVTAKREIVTATRKLERIAKRKGDGGGWMHQSWAEHGGAAEDLAHAQMMLVVVDENADATPAVIEHYRMKIERYTDAHGVMNSRA
jgi:hypothetical protein